MPATALALPATLSNALIELQFDTNVDTDVQLTRIRHKEGGNVDISTVLVDKAFSGPSVAANELDGRLWEVVCLRQSDSAKVVVSPKDAQRFAAHNVSTLYGGGKTVYQFVWEGCAVPGGSEDDRIWVVVQASILAGENVARMRGWCGRHKGATCIIEEFHLPVTWVKGHANQKTLPAPDSSHLVAQKRTRVLTPMSYVLAHQTYSQNSSLWLWASLSLKKTSSHPGIYHSMQFMAIAAMNPETAPGVPDAAYRRTFYFQTEDTRLYRKSFRYTGVLYTGNQGWLGVRHIYHVPYEKGLAGSQVSLIDGYDPALWPSEIENECVLPYEVQLGAYTAKTDAFWYDACERYRNWCISTNYAIPKASNPRFGGGIHGPALISTFSVVAPSHDKAALRTREVYLSRVFRKMFENAYTGAPMTFLHTQKVRIGDQDVSPLDVPIETSVHASTLTWAAQAAAYGMRVGFYQNGIFLLATDSPNMLRLLPHNYRQLARSGAALLGETGAFYNFGVPGAATWMRSVMQTDLAGKVRNAGLYLDQLGGQDVLDQFWNGANPPYAMHNGREHYAGKQAFVQSIREMLAQVSIFGPNDAHAYVYTELFEEGLSSYVDFAQTAYLWIPQHLLMAEETVIPHGITDYPVVARDMSAPIIECVWGGYSQVLQYAMAPCWTPFNHGGPNNQYPKGGFPGLNAAEFRALHCSMSAMIWNAGRKVSFLGYIHDHDHPLVDFNATQTAVEDKTGTGACLQVANFLKALFEFTAESSGAPYFTRGRMERPLVVDYAAAGITKATNPVLPCLTKTHPDDKRVSYPYFYDQAGFEFGDDNFQVPVVLHSMWRHENDGSLLLALTNWSDASASWIASFDPTLYGFLGGFSVDEMDPGGTLTPIFVGGGAQTLGDSGSLPTIDLGTIGARSVRLFKIAEA